MIETKQGSETKANKSTKWVFFLVVATPVITILLALFLVRNVDSSFFGTRNIGKLIEPAQNIASLSTKLSSKNWQILTIIDGTSCNQQCLERLNVVRKAHWALGKEADRVERKAIFINNSGVTDTKLNKTFTKMASINISKQDFNNWISPVSSIIKKDYNLGIIIVDSLGYAFIYYDIENTGNHILIDMRDLLKSASI